MMLLFFISSILGIALSFVYISYSILYVTLLLLIVLLLLRWRSTNEIKQFCLYGIIFFCGVLFGQLRVLLIHYPDVSVFDSVSSEKVALQGVVSREPVSDGVTQKIYLDVHRVTVGTTTSFVDTKILVRTNAYPEFRYGDVLQATGTLTIPEKISEEDGRVFDYQIYLFKDRITHTLSFGSVRKIGEEGNPVLKILFGIKSRFVTSLRDVLPEPHAGLLAGILLGTDTLQKNIKDQFRVAGLSHIIVLSGYNITVVAENLLKIISLVSLRFAFGISLVGVILFVLMAGAGASAVRAGIMASVALIGRNFNKTYNASRTLMLAVWGMIVWNPFIVLYDPSFHLSVIATCGIMYVTPIVEKYVGFITERFGLRELSSTTLGAQLTVLPYILYMSGDFGIFAFPANFLVLPFVPLTMLLGFLTAVFGFVSRFIGLVPGLPTYLLLSWDLCIARVVSVLPYATIHVPYISPVALIIFYLVAAFFVYRFHKKENPSGVGVLRSGDDSVVSY